MSRIHTSEPAFRAPLNQWQRDRATGTIHPMYRPGTWTDALIATGCVGAFAAGLYAVTAVLS